MFETFHCKNKNRCKSGRVSVKDDLCSGRMPSDGSKIPVGFCFSFPMDKLSPKSGILLHWTKVSAMRRLYLVAETSKTYAQPRPREFPVPSTSLWLECPLSRPRTTPLPLLRCFLGRRGVGDFWGQRASPDPVPVFEESSTKLGLLRTSSVDRGAQWSA